MKDVFAIVPTHQRIGLFACVLLAIRDPEFIEGWGRLRGITLAKSIPKTPIDFLIHKATGYDKVVDAKTEATFCQLVEDVKDVVWDRLPAEVQADLCRDTAKKIVGKAVNGSP